MITLSMLQAISQQYPACTIKTIKTTFFGLWEIHTKVDFLTPKIVVGKKVKKQFFGLWEIHSRYDAEEQFIGKTIFLEFPDNDGSWILNAYHAFQSRYPSIWKGGKFRFEKPGTFVGESGSWTYKVLSQRFNLASVEYHGTVQPSSTPTYAERVLRERRMGGISI